MDNNKDENFTVEQLFKEQIDISKYTVVLNLIFVVLVLLFDFDKSIILGIISGCIVSLIFHWLLFNNLRTAIRMDKENAMNYANIHSFIRRILFIAVLVLLVANKWIKINIIGLIIGLLSFKFILYFYNIKSLKNK